MDAAVRQRYETQSKVLRVKIKAWEVEFYQSHDGKKPSRDDIKTSGMNATYKEYQRLRDILGGKISPPAASNTTSNKTKASGATDQEPRKRKSPQQPSYTPSTKRFRAAETPSSRHRALDPLAQFTPDGAAALNAATTPSLSRKLFSPAMPTSIGPTPQRDGRVLGLFDALPFKDADIDSPCKPAANNRAGPVSLSQVIRAGQESMSVAETPRTSARTADVLGLGLGSAARLGRTPSSRHKKHGQHSAASPRKDGTLATPLKSHDGNRVAKTPSGTSLSVSKLQFQTPAFLRRIPMPKISEADGAFTSPEPIRLPRRKPLLRGLSSVVADLRKLQEEELDDDLDALREMENEAAVPSSNNSNLVPAKTGPKNADDEATAKPGAASTKQDKAAILAEDAQTLLGGFDDEGMYDSLDEADAGLDRSGQPLRVYKKKGQKRTTRRSNMRPVRTKRPTTTAVTDGKEDEGEDESTSKPHPNRPTTSSQTLVENDGGGGGGGEKDPAILSSSEFDSNDDDEDELAKDARPDAAKNRTTRRKPAATRGEAPAAGAEAKKKNKAPRKVNELAHANFKRLKLRNNGAKGGAGYNSRFRRRR